jgi:hypothetical protein
VPIFDFTVYLDKQPADTDFDALFEAGLDDTTVESGPNTQPMLHVSRQANTLTEAITTVDQDAAKAGFRIIAISEEDLLTIQNIATKTGRSYESVRLLASGQRGPGGFPLPVNQHSKPALYHWAQVAKWLHTHYGYAITETEQAATINAANHLLKARTIKPDLTSITALLQPPQPPHPRQGEAA